MLGSCGETWSPPSCEETAHEITRLLLPNTFLPPTSISARIWGEREDLMPFQ